MTFPHSSLENYRQVAEAYLGALEEHLATGKNISRIASVASLFVSRVDAPVDTLLQDRIKAAGTGAKSQLKDLEGKAAIAMPAWPTRSSNGCLVGHALRLSRLGGGARAKQLLWASTSTKNPAYRDVLYVEELIGPDTVNTMPLGTLISFREHGRVRPSLEDQLQEANAHLAALAQVGISYEGVTRQLQEEGVQKFIDSFQKLFGCIDKKRQALRQEQGLSRGQGEPTWKP